MDSVCCQVYEIDVEPLIFPLPGHHAALGVFRAGGKTGGGPLLSSADDMGLWAVQALREISQEGRRGRARDGKTPGAIGYFGPLQVHAQPHVFGAYYFSDRTHADLTICLGRGDHRGVGDLVPLPDSRGRASSPRTLRRSIPRLHEAGQALDPWRTLIILKMDRVPPNE